VSIYAALAIGWIMCEVVRRAIDTLASAGRKDHVPRMPLKQIAGPKPAIVVDPCPTCGTDECYHIAQPHVHDATCACGRCAGCYMRVKCVCGKHPCTCLERCTCGMRKINYPVHRVEGV